MAGEIEEPLSFSFQADSIHSGSISFGRFEHESLSWERRSAFSHNKYVEEVEKCLKPGSVIERKAYFEAHFKKKGLPRPNLADCSYSGADNRVRANDGSESDDEFEHGNEGSSYAESDERSEGSVYLGDFEVAECKKEEDAEVSFSGPERASVLNNHIAILVDGEVEDVNFEETHQPEKGCDNSSSIVDEPERDVNKNHSDDAVNADHGPSKTVSICPKTEPAECVDKTMLESGKSSTSKLKAAKELKLFKPKASVPAEASKDPRKKSNTRETEGTRRTDKQKLSSKTATPTSQSVRRTPKLDDSRGLKGKSLNESKRDKESSGKKFGEPQPSALKPESRRRQMTNRLSNRADFTKSNTRSSVATFNFKSSERAERRKEFYMKLEEKMHAKEDEMNKIQASKQEKTEAEMKRLRKGLNFKAAPMPCFYQVARTSGPDGSKTVSTKSSKVERSHGNAPRVRLASHSEAGNNVDATGETKCMMAKGRKSERKVGAEKNSREMAGRKGVVGFGSSSRMSHLPVGVAS